MSTSLASLVADVYTLTNRPDLVGETTLAVRNATLKAHRTDFYPKDLFETGIVFDFAQPVQSLEYKELIPRWRALKYLREYIPGTDPSDGVTGDFYEIVTPDNVLDSYNINKENVCYMAGSELKVRTRSSAQYFLLGCYIYPDVTPENFRSWIADEHPSTIVYEAAATVFKTIGFDEQFSAYQSMVQAEYQMLKEQILANGY